MEQADSLDRTCNICGGSAFGPGPAGRLTPMGELPCCRKCGSLERHRALRNFYLHLPIGMLNWRNALQFSPDLAIRPEWFKAYEISVYGGENSLDIQKIDRAGASFDLISLNHVIEFVVDAKAAFLELARVLSPKGIIQIGFSQLETRATTVDYRDAQGIHGFYHLFGLDCGIYFDIKLINMYMIGLHLPDLCTNSSESFHFFSRDLDELVKLKTYAALSQF